MTRASAWSKTYKLASSDRTPPDVARRQKISRSKTRRSVSSSKAASLIGLQIIEPKETPKRHKGTQRRWVAGFGGGGGGLGVVGLRVVRLRVVLGVWVETPKTRWISMRLVSQPCFGESPTVVRKPWPNWSGCKQTNSLLVNSEHGTPKGQKARQGNRMGH